jgi:hypothetical protein
VQVGVGVEMSYGMRSPVVVESQTPRARARHRRTGPSPRRLSRHADRSVEEDQDKPKAEDDVRVPLVDMSHWAA